MGVVNRESEMDYLQIAGIQHFVFCRRQWALIHIEQQWAENYFTIDGSIKHAVVDSGNAEKNGTKRILRSLRVVSHALQIQGVCDVVELISDRRGAYFSKYDDTYRVYPVEYKRGKPKDTESDVLQLVAQTICLEEMMGVDISEGAIFYFETRHREIIEITSDLREKIKQIVAEMNQYYQRKYTPRVRKTKKCRACSLKDICLPELIKCEPASSYLERMMKQ